MVNKLDQKIISNIISRNLGNENLTVIVWNIPLLAKLINISQMNIAILQEKEISEVLLLEQQIATELREALNKYIAVTIYDKYHFKDRLAKGYPPELFIKTFGKVIVGVMPDVNINISERALQEYLNHGFISFGLMLNDLMRGNTSFARENAFYAIYYALTAMSLKSTQKIPDSTNVFVEVLEKVGKRHYLSFVNKIIQVGEYASSSKRENTLNDLLLDSASRDIIISSYMALKLAWEYINQTKIASIEKFVNKLSPIINHYEIIINMQGTLPAPILRAKTPEREYIIELTS